MHRIQIWCHFLTQLLQPLWYSKYQFILLQSPPPLAVKLIYLKTDGKQNVVSELGLHCLLSTNNLGFHGDISKVYIFLEALLTCSCDNTKPNSFSRYDVQHENKALMLYENFKDATQPVHLYNMVRGFSVCQHVYSIHSLRKHAYSNILTTKNWKFLDKKFWYFSYFCSKHRLWVLVRTASARQF